MIYRDLKLENILLDEEGFIRITDFGLSKISLNARSICGTLVYVAPEVFGGSSYSKEVDYWALGCLIYEMIYGKSAFYSDSGKINELKKIITQGKYYFPEDVNLSI